MADKQIEESRKPQAATQECGAEDVNLKKDHPFQSFFSKTQPLSIIIKGVVPEFRDMAAKEIERYIEVEFEEKDSDVEYDSSAKLLDPKGRAAGEGATEFDVYFKLKLPDGTGRRFALYLDLEMQQDFAPGYDIVKRSVYYPARMMSKQLTSLRDRKMYNRIQKVHSIWIFASGYAKKLKNRMFTYSLRRTGLSECAEREKEVLNLDRRIDLMDISYLFVGETVDEDAAEVMAFLNACFYDKEKLKDHPEWLDPGNLKLKEAAETMGNFAVFYEKRGEAIGKVTKVIELVKEGLADGLTDAAMTRYFCITRKELDRIKELIGRYSDNTAQELAEIYLEQEQEDVS